MMRNIPGRRLPKSEQTRRPMEKQESIKKKRKRMEKLEGSIHDLLVESRKHVYKEFLLERHQTFINLVQNDREDSVGAEAIRLYKKLDDKKDKKFWLRKGKKGHLVFRAYLQRWCVEANLDFYNELHQITSHKRDLKKFFPSLFDTYIGDGSEKGGVFVTDEQRAELTGLHKKYMRLLQE
jgi:hypothetical protein